MLDWYTHAFREVNLNPKDADVLWARNVPVLEVREIDSMCRSSDSIIVDSKVGWRNILDAEDDVSFSRFLRVIDNFVLGCLLHLEAEGRERNLAVDVPNVVATTLAWSSSSDTEAELDK